MHKGSYLSFNTNYMYIFSIDITKHVLQQNVIINPFKTSPKYTQAGVYGKWVL